MDGENTVAPAPNLEQMRDEKCIPVARETLALVAEKMMYEEKKPELLLAILQGQLDADLNITTESPYIFQLLLGALSGLNATIQECEVAPVDDLRYAAIGTEILKILSEANVSLTNITPEMTKEEFAPVKEKLNALFLAQKLTSLELKYIVDKLFTGFRDLSTAVQQQIEDSLKTAEAKFYGISDMDQLTVGALDKALKEGTPEATA